MPDDGELPANTSRLFFEPLMGVPVQANLEGQILALSNLDSHVTFVRGYAVLHPFSEHPEFQQRHTIAPELGHITLNTRDEDKAEKKARALLRGQLVAVNR